MTMTGFLDGVEDNDDDDPVSDRKTPFLERRSVRRLLPWLVVVALFGLWEAGVFIFNVPAFVLPAPSAVFASGWEWREPILQNAGQTLFTTVIGFALAILVGLIGGVALGSSVILYESFYPALIGFNSIPKVAVVPILVIWFGVGTVPAIITAFLLAFFPILVNVATGIATLEPELRDVLRALGASRRQVITKVGLPRAMPYFFASLKIAVTVAFVDSIVSETIASNKGIGYLMLVATSRFEVPLAFAALLVTGVMGVGRYVIGSIFERRMTGWATRSAPGGGFAPQG